MFNNPTAIKEPPIINEPKTTDHTVHTFLSQAILAFASIQCKVCGHSIGITTMENSPATIVKYGKEILDKLEMLEKEIQKK